MMESLEKRQLKVLFPAVRAAYIELTTGGGSISEAVRVLREANEAAMREAEWTTLENLRPGALFEDRLGARGVRRSSNGTYIRAISLETGAEYIHSRAGIVREIFLPEEA